GGARAGSRARGRVPPAPWPRSSVRTSFVVSGSAGDIARGKKRAHLVGRAHAHHQSVPAISAGGEVRRDSGDAEARCLLLEANDLIRIAVDIECDLERQAVQSDRCADLDQYVDAPDVALLEEVGLVDRAVHGYARAVLARERYGLVRLARSGRERRPLHSGHTELGRNRQDAPFPALAEVRR